MIRFIYTFSRNDIEELLTTNETLKTELPWYLISIGSNKNNRVIKDYHSAEILQSKGCRGVLFREFYDLTPQNKIKLKEKYPRLKIKLKIFSIWDAIRIILFIKKINKKEDCILIVQCKAGISRSGAIAVFANRYLGLDEEIFKTNNPFIYPNSYIYNTLCSVVRFRSTQPDYWMEYQPRR